jgi:hypothetical protein
MREGINTLQTRLLLAVMVALLAGCGSQEKSISDGPDYSASELQVFTSARSSAGVTDNILSLAWTELYGVDFYRVYAAVDGHSGFVQVGEDFYIVDAEPGPDELPICYYVPDGEPDEPGVDCLDFPPNCADVLNGVPFVDCQPILVLYNYEGLVVHLFDWPDALFMLEACTVVPAECYTVGTQSAAELSDKTVDGFTAPAPNQTGSTFGISVAASEDGLFMAVGANTASLFECAEVTYTDEVLYEDEGKTIRSPCQVLRKVPDCDDVAEPDPGNNCVDFVDYCVDVADPDPGINCVDILPYCEDRTDPNEGVNCELKPPYCVELPDPEAGEEQAECLDFLPDCRDRTDGEAGVDCQVIIDAAYCEALGADEAVPLGCIVNESIPNAGAVYLYGRDTAIDPWVLAAMLKAPNAEENDNFGWSVAMSDDGSTIVVAALGEDGDSRGDPENNDTDSSGAAYVYTLDVDEWVFADYLKADNAESEDLFGWALDISGDGSVIAVSAAREAFADLAEVDGELLCEGAVYVYGLDGLDQWSQQDYLKAANRQQNDVFGQSVALDYTGSVLAVGASQEPDNSLLDIQFDPFTGDFLLSGCNPKANPADNTGFVSLFERSETSWSLLDELRASNPDDGDGFGYSVAFNSGAGIDDNVVTRLAVGAPGESSGSSGVNGAQDNDALAFRSGAAYLFEKDDVSGAWNQNQYLKSSNTGPTDVFGNSVALSRDGEVLAVAAWGEAGPFTGINSPQGYFGTPGTGFNQVSGSGAIYVFVEDEVTSWGQVAYVKPPGIFFDMGFGWDVEIVDDGNMLIGTAPAFKTFGGLPGSVFVY